MLTTRLQTGYHRLPDRLQDPEEIQLLRKHGNRAYHLTGDVSVIGGYSPKGRIYLFIYNNSIDRYNLIYEHIIPRKILWQFDESRSRLIAERTKQLLRNRNFLEQIIRQHEMTGEILIMTP